MTLSAEQRERDRVHMARCLELAEAYRGRTSPNPIVGCVIVDRAGKVIAEGAHEGPGTAHGEIAALTKLKKGAKGATLYVNLEPCNHQGRTPPCAPVVRDSGVARVVIGIEDPVPGHGGGIELLRRAKVATTVGVLREACTRANQPFLIWAQHSRPAFTLKAAITLDGKIATVAGQSKWITNATSRMDVMKLRNAHDAVMVGIGTVLADNPRLTARFPKARDPIRIVLDSDLRTPPDSYLFQGKVKKIIVCAPKASGAREAALVAVGAEVWRNPTHRNGRLDLHPLARRLADAGLTSVLVEGGGEVHAYFLEHRLADQIVIYIAPKIVGGPAKSWVGGKGLASMGAAIPFTLDDEILDLAGDLRLTGLPVPVPPSNAPPDPDD